MIAPWAFAVLVLGTIGFQVALIAGAPWGHLTQGGQSDGALPPGKRALAGLSILLLGFMALAILSAAGQVALGWPRWTGWVALAISGLSTIANWITPSAAERRLWAPITTLMLACAAWAMLGERG